MTTNDPTGQEREVRNFGGTSIDGAPIPYIVVLAAVVAALAFIPFSIILAFGGSFPVSQGIWGLVGWMLGPIAGAVATGIGTIVGVVVAPHTAGIWPVRIYGAVLASFAGGLMLPRPSRNKWWIGVALLSILSFVLYVGRAVMMNGVSLQIALLGSFLDWSAILLFILPTRTLFGRWIGGKNVGLLAVGPICRHVGHLRLISRLPIRHFIFHVELSTSGVDLFDPSDPG